MNNTAEQQTRRVSLLRLAYIGRLAEVLAGPDAIPLIPLRDNLERRIQRTCLALVEYDQSDPLAQDWQILQALRFVREMELATEAAVEAGELPQAPGGGFLTQCAALRRFLEAECTEKEKEWKQRRTAPDSRGK